MKAELVTHETSASPAAVWAALSDGWLYPSWVVGASRMRAVSKGFPEPGTVLHHSTGLWPALIHDETRVLECEPGRRLLLRANGGPLGAAEVELILEPNGSGTRIRMREDAVSGPGRLVPWPVRQAGTRLRNQETLLRLAFLAERADRPGDNGGATQ